MIAAFQKDDAFLDDIARSPTEPDELRVWWLGQSGFLVRHRGEFLLLDPYLSDSLTLKYAVTDKPHERMTERVIAPGRLTKIGVITSSHNHTDHLDADTLKPLLQTNPGATLIIPEANRAFVSHRLAIDSATPLGLDAGTSIEAEGWRVTGVAAAHNELDRDSAGHHLYLGYIIRRGPWTLYHSGDTLLYPVLAETLRGFEIDIAFLPINGNRPERRVAGNLDGREAARLAHDCGARWVIPCHYEMFAFNTATTDDFIAECRHLAQPCCPLRAGEGWTCPES